jgi:prepilin-type N-terminal cleavage/methylation domain-containing protein
VKHVAKLHRSNGFSILEIITVLGIIGVISAIAVPMFANAIAGFRVSGDARSVSNAAAVAKMRAASDFSRVRLYVDLDARTHKIQSWSKASEVPPKCCWVTEGGTTALSTGVNFGFGVVAAAPPNTQATIGQAAPCTADDDTPIANTACIMFNSRGVPVDSSLAPTKDALYVTDGAMVYGVTVAATGMLRLWRTLPVETPQWVVN